MKTTSKAVTTTASTSTASATAVAAAAGTSTCFHEPNHNGPDSVGVLVVAGTFTSATPVVEIKMDGGSVWLGVSLTEQKTLASTAAPAPSNSTTTSYRFSCAGAKFVRGFNTAGTLTAQTMEITTGTAAEFGNDRAVLNNSVSALQTFAGGFTLPDNAAATVGSGSDFTLLWDGTDLIAGMALADSTIKWGVSGAGINHVFYGDTATRDATWDQSNDQLLFNDNAKLAVGTGAGGVGDFALWWDGTRGNFTQLTTNSELRWGVDGAGIDQMWYGDTASAFLIWDQSADQLIFGGVASVSGVRFATSGATSITTTRAVTKADSGGVFTVTQGSTYTVTVAQPAAAGERYLFQCIAPGAFDVSLIATGCTFEGTITIDAATIPATGSTLKFATGAAILGDSIELVSTSTTKFLVRAISSGAGGITIS